MNNDLISRSELLAFAHLHYGRIIDCNDIARFPAVDAVKVVRCKDCLHYRPWLYGDKICALIGSYYGKKQPDDYCSRGRKCE